MLNKDLLKKVQNIKSLNLNKEEIAELRAFWIKSTGIVNAKNCGSCVKKYAKLYRNHFNSQYVEEVVEEVVEEKSEYQKNTKAELEELLRLYGVDFPSRCNKSDLIKLVEEYERSKESGSI